MDLGVARGVQWWYPHTPLKCKVAKVTKALISLPPEMAVVNVYAMNTTDVEQIKLLEEAPVQTPVNRVYVDDVNIDSQPDILDDLPRIDQRSQHGTTQSARRGRILGLA